MAVKAKKSDKYSALESTLGKELAFNGARIKCLTLLITALIKVQSVNFERLAQGFDNPVLLGSNLRRIQRFFASFDLPRDLIARLLFKLLPVGGPYRLALDRTNWKFGVRNINILMLGVVYKGLSLPILWTILDNKRGNSDQAEREALIKRYIDLFGVQRIESLAADREFIGRDWHEFLVEWKIQFFIRLRENMQVYIPGRGIVKAYWLFNNLPHDTALHYPKIVRVKGCWMYLSGSKIVNEQGQIEFLIVASYRYTNDALAYYKERWQIETMFKAFKTNGFNLESTHLKDYERIDKLLMVLSLAFNWAYKIGIYKDREIRKIKLKKHGRPEYSLFAYGLKWLAQVLINTYTQNIQKLSNLFLSCT